MGRPQSNPGSNSSSRGASPSNKPDPASRRSRRPDREVYVPRRRLEKLERDLAALSMENGSDRSEASEEDEPGGGVLPAGALRELTALLTPSLEVVPAHNDFSTYDTEICFADFEFVVELYDFPVAFRERDLLRAFEKYRSAGGFEIKWINDTSAFGVFSSADAGELPSS